MSRVEFADSHAKMSYEIAEAVRRLDGVLPIEHGKRVTLVPIVFGPKDDEKGEAVLFFADDFMRTNEDETVHFIRPRTQTMLDKLGVSYKVTDPKTGKSLSH